MSLKKIFLFVSFVGLFSRTNAQSFDVGFLFNSGLTLGSEFVPNAAINDSVDFQLTRHKAQFVLPLKTQFGVKGLKFKDFSFKKLDAKASQLFLTFNGNVTQPSFSENNGFENIYGGEFGLTGLYASVKKGIWIYSTNLYFAENSTTLSESPTPNFRGYVAKVKIKSLKFIYFYGASLIVNQGKFIPVPLFGFRKKINSKISASLVFPIQTKLNYKQGKNLNFDLGANFNGINAIFREGSAIKKNDNTINYRQLKTYFGINAKMGKHFKIITELGYSSLQKMTGVRTDFSQRVDASPYVSLSINYHFGKSVFDNFINKME